MEVQGMIVVRKLGLGLFLAGAVTCVAVSAPPQNGQPSADGRFYYGNPFTAYTARDGQTKAPFLAHRYVETKKEDEKRQIREQLKDILNHEFDDHIKAQQKELEDVEKQIAKLKEVVRKRLDAKSTIVDRRLEQLIQDAEGLGWNAPSSPHPNLRNSFVPLYPAPAPK
jgi:hypothetical protein